MSTWTVTILSPLIGLIISNIMWASPMKAIILTRKDNDIGPLNPVPFVITVFNCIGWTIYACMKHDYFIFFSNATGLLFGVYYSVSLIIVLTFMQCEELNKTYKNKDRIAYLDSKRYQCEVLLLFSVGFWCFMSVIAAIVLNNSRELAITFIGILCCCTTLAYYAAPLSSVIEIIKTSDASSIYLPTIIINLINAFCWFIYGVFGIHDLVVWLPNLIGAILAIGEIAVKLFYKYAVIKPDNSKQVDVSDKTTINYLHVYKSNDLTDDNGSDIDYTRLNE